MLIKVGNAYYNNTYLCKLYAVQDGKYYIQFANGNVKEVSDAEYAEIAEENKVLLNGEYYLDSNKIRRVAKIFGKTTVEFKNGEQAQSNDEDTESLVEHWYHIGNYYYNPNEIVRLFQVDGEYYVQFVAGAPVTITQSEYEAILAIPQKDVFVTEEKTVALDMASGNQVIDKSDDADGMTKVVVEKPATLVEGNIAKDVNIGGVVGTLEFTTETKTAALNMLDGDMVITKSSDKDGMTEVTIEKPSSLIAENIKKDVDIGGVVGTFEGAVDHGGKYHILVIDYDGTILKEDHLNAGAIFELPDAPTNHSRLVFQEWSCPVQITNNTITVDGDITIGPVYDTVSGKCEYDIELTPVTGLTVTCKSSSTEIDWGDGTVDYLSSHTYADYGKYTIKSSNTNLSGDYMFGQSPTTSNYACLGMHLHITNILGNYEFSYCTNVRYVTMSNPSQNRTISRDMFRLAKLQTLAIPSNISIGYQGLNKATIKRIILPYQLATPGTETMVNTTMVEAILPRGSGFTTIPASAFQTNNQIFGRIKIPNNVTTINANAFSGCTMVLLYDFTDCTSIVTLSDTSAFNSINPLCKIVVPDSLYNSWKADGNWVTYANYIYKESEVTL